jgi:hypothetical protein
MCHYNCRRIALLKIILSGQKTIKPQKYHRVSRDNINSAVFCQISQWQQLTIVVLFMNTKNGRKSTLNSARWQHLSRLKASAFLFDYFC